MVAIRVRETLGGQGTNPRELVLSERNLRTRRAIFDGC